MLPGQELLDHATALIKEWDEIEIAQDALNKRESEIKAMLQSICVSNKLPGLHHGRVGVRVTPTNGKRTLSKIRIIEDGISAERLATWYQAGIPGVRVTLESLDRPRKPYPGQDDGEED